MMKRLLPAAAAAALLLLTTAGCTSAASRDRTTGRDPDTLRDATNVVVYRNADDVPNLAFWCIGPWRFWGTLNTNNDRAAVVERFYDGDKDCPGGVPQ